MTPSEKDRERAREIVAKWYAVPVANIRDSGKTPGIIAQALADRYAEGRRDVLQEMNSDGCPHGCVFPCPFHRQLDKISKIRAQA